MYENRVPAQSPVFGLRVANRDVPLPTGFSPEQLDTVYADLASTAHGFDMLMESASFGEVDSYYNPGEEEVSPDFILEAIVVDRFSQTERRMSAVVRVLNRFLSGSEIKALLPIVGKPRKTGAYAYVTVQLPFSDGQTISVVFHSPEGDKKKIAANDTIIAFQWLLNRRDITHVVAPENGSEISLDELSKKITQLVVKNSARFERTQKDASEERKVLDDTRKAVDDAEDSQRELISTIANATSESETVDAKLSNTLSLLEKQKGINAELQAKLEALEKARANGGDTKADDIAVKLHAMVAEAARWRGAAMKAAQLVANDKKKALALSRLTTKGDLDAYLMKKFGVDASTARDVSNELTDKNIPDDMAAEISDYAEEEWAKLASEQNRSTDPDLKRPERQEEPFAAFLDGYNSKSANPYLLTSDKSDAFVLGRYFAQNGYERPRLAVKSRGDSWRVVMNSEESTALVEAVFNVDGEVVKPKSGPSPRKDEKTYSTGSLEKTIASLMSEVTAKGIVVPSPSEYMADVDAGRREGKSKSATAQDLKAHKQNLAGLKSGTVTSRKILGAGGKKEMAEAWLIQEIDACYTALEDGTGFRCTTNMGNYASMLRSALNGKDISAQTDGEVEEEQGQRDKESQARTVELLELENRANQMKNYSTGSLDGMKEPFELKFTIQNDAIHTIVELGELTTPQAKYEYLRDKAQSASGQVKLDTIQLNRQIELNGALRKGIVFDHFKIEPRTGYCVVTCTIDLSGVSGGVVSLAGGAQPQTAPTEPPFVATLRDILAGKHDNDTARMGSLLDTAAEDAEKSGLMGEHEGLFNQAADHLTAMLKKRAA